jgi:outer membrane lipoprotein SlyB
MTYVPRGLTVACAALALASLTACATSSPPGYSTYPSHQQPGYQQPGYGAEFGRVSSIQIVQVPQGGQTSGAGAVVGAVAGGVLGNQIGGGRGRTAATVVGAVAGGLAGNAVEGRMQQGYTQMYRISIQLDQGGVRAYDVSSPGDLRQGDRVRLVNGQISRY